MGVSFKISTENEGSAPRKSSGNRSEDGNANNIGINGRTYSVGDDVSSNRYKEMTKSLFGALAALDRDRDGVISHEDVVHASRTLQRKEKEVNLMRQMIAVGILSIILVSASALGVSLWANEITKEAYAEGDNWTNGHGEILKSGFKLETDEDIFAMVDKNWDFISTTEALEFTVDATPVRFVPAVITRQVTYAGDNIITFRAHHDKIVLTGDSITYTPVGGVPIKLTEREHNTSNRALNRDSSFTISVRPPNSN